MPASGWLRRSAPRSLFLALSLSLLGCGEDPVEPPDCQPSLQEWEDSVQALVQDNCGRCHGTNPNFGAPFTLLDYDAITAGVEGERIVDQMHVQLVADSMPPAGSPRPTTEQRDAIASWASCGSVRIEDMAGATRNPFTAPEDPPAGLETIDLLADEYAVGPDVLDRYHEIDFTNLTEEEMFIRRFDAVIDDSRVLHHLTLRRGDPSDELSMKYLYAWAPGTGAIQFPSGGVRLKPGDNLRLQIHYNNGSGVEGVRDSSGVRLFVAEPGGDEYYMIDPGPGASGFAIDARQTATVDSICEFQSPVRAIASMPHMHEIGMDFDLLVSRDGGDAESILALSTWDFESQLFYELPVEFAAGDQLTVRCNFENPLNDTVRAGPRTSDEMCFAFTYVTPPPTEGGLLCRPLGSSDSTVLDYQPGTCISAPLDAPTIRADVEDQAMAPEFDAEGVIGEGNHLLSRFLITTSDVGLVSLATFTAAGQLRREGDVVTFDCALHLIAPTEELREGDQTDFSFSGTLDMPMGPARLQTSCPAEGIDVPFDFATIDGVPVVHFVPDGFPADVALWFFLEPAS